MHRRIVEERDGGTAVIIVSSELDEIYALADRIAVMYEGQITGFRPPTVPVTELGLLMAGVSDSESGSASAGAVAASPPGRARRTPAPAPARRPPDCQTPGRWARTRTRRRWAGRRSGAAMTGDPGPGGTSGGPPEPDPVPATGPVPPDDGACPSGPVMPDGSATAATPSGGGGPLRGLDRALWDAITHGSPAVVTFLAIFLALVLGGLLIAFSDTTVLHVWSTFFSHPGTAISAAWQSVAGAYSAMFEGAIVNPHTISAAFHGGSVGAIFYPLSETAAQATPLVLTGLSVALAFRAGLFNIGAQSQWIGGAIVATYLGFAISLPLVLHAIVCLIGGFAGGAIMGWLVGELKARTGAHEVIVTIMLNYIMIDLLADLPAPPRPCSCRTRPT